MNEMKMNGMKNIVKATMLALMIGICGLAFSAEETVKQEVKQEQKVKDNGGEARVNINTAGETALDTLPGVGPAIAKRIIALREENGAFKSVEELMNVKGIGDKTFDKLKDRITI